MMDMSSGMMWGMGVVRLHLIGKGFSDQTIPLHHQTVLILAKLCSRRRATVMATDCAPLSADDPEMENGSHRSPPLSARSPES